MWKVEASCDGNHKRTRTCTESCGTDDCTAAGAVAGVITEDCIGTIQGTLFDASDLSSCPANIGTDAGYASLRLGSAAFGILGMWPAITAPVSTDANGNYSEQVYASTTNGTYSFDYADLISSGRASGVKLQCQGASASVTTQGQVVTKDTGFWRVYSGNQPEIDSGKCRRKSGSAEPWICLARNRAGNQSQCRSE
ncbi:MAG: hypothetical protein UV30_C0018G0002 [Candidatus Collierbacteria bacterium GW2011_GWF1_42_50]|nr:MAG: hypothetical protein UV30_C0018G0002 [Candidatus Collierbacteria bacterium GW2011_GWF1_42_50]